MKTLRYIVITIIAALTLAACGGNAPATTGNDSTAAANDSASGPLRVGATPVPHAEILQFVKDNLAGEAGLELEIVNFTDYVQPNIALNDGQIDANFFQHVPYMEEFGAQRGINMVAVANVHIEPLGIYSSSVESLDAVPEGAVVAIPNDPTNGGRALQLLAANGLITLNEGVGTNATVRDIAENPKNLRITELEAAQLPRALADATLAVINTNYALEADLTPAEDALALESGQDNPYANVLTALEGKQDDPRIQQLAELLNSPEVKQFIEERYEGAVVPAF
jgi:D-methionine transport system substrate-binding protein